MKRDRSADKNWVTKLATFMTCRTDIGRQSRRLHRNCQAQFYHHRHCNYMPNNLLWLVLSTFELNVSCMVYVVRLFWIHKLSSVHHNLFLSLISNQPITSFIWIYRQRKCSCSREIILQAKICQQSIILQTYICRQSCHTTGVCTRWWIFLPYMLGFVAAEINN